MHSSYYDILSTTDRSELYSHAMSYGVDVWFNMRLQEELFQEAHFPSRLPLFTRD